MKTFILKIRDGDFASFKEALKEHAQSVSPNEQSIKDLNADLDNARRLHNYWLSTEALEEARLTTASINARAKQQYELELRNNKQFLANIDKMIKQAYALAPLPTELYHIKEDILTRLHFERNRLNESPSKPVEVSVESYRNSQLDCHKANIFRIKLNIDRALRLNKIMQNFFAEDE